MCICEGAALTCDGEDNNLQELGFYHVSPGEASGPPQVCTHITYDNSDILVTS